MLTQFQSIADRLDDRQHHGALVTFLVDPIDGFGNEVILLGQRTLLEKMVFEFRGKGVQEYPRQLNLISYNEGDGDVPFETMEDDENIQFNWLQ